MWISKKEWSVLKKRVADLEEQVQGQLNVEIDVDAIRQIPQKLEANRGRDAKAFGL